jgi:hypothetical protein
MLTGDDRDLMQLANLAVGQHRAYALHGRMVPQNIRDLHDLVSSRRAQSLDIFSFVQSGFS